MMSLVGGRVVGASSEEGDLFARHLEAGQAGSGTDGVRYAALLLHAMAPADRNWMLDALSSAQRQQINGLLQELEAVGVSRDPLLISEATADDDSNDRPSDEEFLMGLGRSDVEQAVACLRTEPAELLAQWLQCAHWPWREELLGALEANKRRELKEILVDRSVSGRVTPRAMRAKLIEAVARVVRETTVPAAPSSLSWEGVRYRVGRLLKKDVSASERAR
ncbi:hypothetical protein [Pseudacidovorax intermedius]|uniref:hypothetical protein n=1 Tax=Pseudacidovorax intermedius TaxID=433924 RepID=UPI0005C28614|nr:hypothetical protein [Pseudacidovorax intermedius]